MLVKAWLEGISELVVRRQSVWNTIVETVHQLCATTNLDCDIVSTHGVEYRVYEIFVILKWKIFSNATRLWNFIFEDKHEDGKIWLQTWKLKFS